jgi:hypothetical protein
VTRYEEWVAEAITEAARTKKNSALPLNRRVRQTRPGGALWYHVRGTVTVIGELTIEVGSTK